MIEFSFTPRTGDVEDHVTYRCSDENEVCCRQSEEIEEIVITDEGEGKTFVFY